MQGRECGYPALHRTSQVAISTAQSVIAVLAAAPTLMVTASINPIVCWGEGVVEAVQV